MTLRNIMLSTLQMFNMPFAAFLTLDKAFLPPLFLQTCSDILDLTLNLFWLCLKFYDFAFSHNVWVENHNFRLLNKIQRILNLHLTLNISLYHVYSGEGSVVNVTCDNTNFFLKQLLFQRQLLSCFLYLEKKIPRLFSVTCHWHFSTIKAYLKKESKNLFIFDSISILIFIKAGAQTSSSL